MGPCPPPRCCGLEPPLLITVASSAFLVVGPRTWNDLPDDLALGESYPLSVSDLNFICLPNYFLDWTVLQLIFLVDLAVSSLYYLDMHFAKSGVIADVTAIAKCTMPQESNVCGEYKIKWLFDASAGACTRSWDSGCDVDAHRFDTEEDCQSVCVNPPGYGTVRLFAFHVNTNYFFEFIFKMSSHRLPE